jgi:hypothetical protein
MLGWNTVCSGVARWLGWNTVCSGVARWLGWNTVCSAVARWLGWNTVCSGVAQRTGKCEPGTTKGPERVSYVQVKQAPTHFHPYRAAFSA